MVISWRRICLAVALYAAGAEGQTTSGRVAVTGRNNSLERTGAKPASVVPGSNLLSVRRPKLATPVVPLSSVMTASPAESFALSGNLAYVCDDNEISVVDVSNPASPRVIATALSGLVQNSADIHCAVQRNTLIVFADQVSSLLSGPGPGVSTFSLSNPLQPTLITAFPLNKRFFQEPVYLGNFAFVPTSALTYFLKIQWDGQYGDLLSLDLTNLSSPALLGALEQPQVDSVLGAQSVVLGASQADTSLIYLGGSTSIGAQNNGSGRLQVVDVTRPDAMSVAGQLLIPGTIHFDAPLIQGAVAVGIGNNGGYGPNGTPAQGNIVVATFDITNRRAPTTLSTTTTTFKAGPGGGATRIGNYLFAFAGVVDANNAQVLLIVDITNPSVPVLQSFPLSQPLTSMLAMGSTLYATLGSGGFATYSIPGIGTGAISACPVSIDALLVVDRGAQISGASWLNAKAALKSFIDSLQLPLDQTGIVSFTTTAHLDQTLTTTGVQAKSAVDAITSGGNSYIGAGITAAQQELTSPRHNSSSTPIMIVLSDGADAGAPNNTATLAAANAAKAAGIRIMTLQYGSSPSALMQSIATSIADFYLVTQ